MICCVPKTGDWEGTEKVLSSFYYSAGHFRPSPFLFTKLPSLYSWASELLARLLGDLSLDFNYRCCTLNAPEPVWRVLRTSSTWHGLRVPALQKGTVVKKGVACFFCLNAGGFCVYSMKKQGVGEKLPCIKRANAARWVSSCQAPVLAWRKIAITRANAARWVSSCQAPVLA